MKKKILIAGAGSIGTVLGMQLQERGHQVSLLRRSGEFGSYAINMVGEETKTVVMNVIDSSSLDTQNPDIIVVTSQNQQTPDIIEDLSSMENSGVILILQNGLEIAKPFLNIFSDDEVLQGAVWWSATLISDREVLFHRKAPTIIGIPSGSSAKEDTLTMLSSILGEITEITTSDNIEGEMQKKLILNVVSPILALIKQPYPAGLNNLHIRKIIHILFDEALDIAKRENWNIEDDKLINFHEMLKTDKIIELKEQVLPSHKVSTQIGAEKYGGLGSNANALLGFFVSNGAQAAKLVLDRVMLLNKNYNAIDDEEIQNLLQNLLKIRTPCEQV